MTANEHEIFFECWECSEIRGERWLEDCEDNKKILNYGFEEGEFIVCVVYPKNELC